MAVSKPSQSGGCIVCVFILAMATGLVLYAVLPVVGVDVPLWVKIANGVLCGVLLLLALARAALARLTRGKGSKPGKRPGVENRGEQ
jgi:hypothetical protein